MDSADDDKSLTESDSLKTSPSNSSTSASESFSSLSYSTTDSESLLSLNSSKQTISSEEIESERITSDSDSKQSVESTESTESAESAEQQQFPETPIEEVKCVENIQPLIKPNLWKLLEARLADKNKTDVQVRIGETIFNCHMYILRCYSGYFMESNNIGIIDLPEDKISTRGFQLAYDWMCEDDATLQREGILDTLIAANFLRVRELVKQCWACFDEFLIEDTALLMYFEARSKGLEDLQHIMITRVSKFFLTLVASKEFLELSAGELSLWLSSNIIGVNTELEVFMSLIRWLDFNWEERKKEIKYLIHYVRFGLIPGIYLAALQRTFLCTEIQRVVSNPHVTKLISKGLYYSSLVQYRSSPDVFRDMLERYQLETPVERRWIYDKACKYHCRFERTEHEPEMEPVTYNSFLEYLVLLQNAGKNHWRSIEFFADFE